MAYVGKRSRCGTYTVTPWDGGPAVQRDLLCCVHCGYVWCPSPGSGKRRGWCGQCCGFTCGHVACEAKGCVPLEQWLLNVEGGKPEDHRVVVG